MTYKKPKYQKNRTRMMYGVLGMNQPKAIWPECLLQSYREARDRADRASNDNIVKKYCVEMVDGQYFKVYQIVSKKRYELLIK